MKPVDVRGDEERGLLDLSPLTKEQRRAIDGAAVDRRLHPPRSTWWTRLRDWLRRLWRWVN
jgi:hypothetical protein